MMIFDSDGKTKAHLYFFETKPFGDIVSSSSRRIILPLNYSVSSSAGNVVTTGVLPPCRTHLVAQGPAEYPSISKKET